MGILFSALRRRQRPPKRDLLCLPDDLLRICLSSLDPESKRAALATCKALARAVMHTSMKTVLLDAGPQQAALRTAKLLLQLWGEQEALGHHGRRITVALGGSDMPSPKRSVAKLLAAGVRLPFITELFLHGLSLDELLPGDVGTLLPNLRTAIVSLCQLTQAASSTLLDCAPFGHLRELVIHGLSVTAPHKHKHAAIMATQLRQLARLPSLSGVELKDDSCPTLFLPDLGTQLTRLRLDESYRQFLPHTLNTPTPGWRATLQQVAQCTGLRELAIPCNRLEELRLVAPALPQLRVLFLNSPVKEFTVSKQGQEGDAVVRLLLGLPHLTNLIWECSLLTLAKWHNDDRCRWEALSFAEATPNVLARLPLHSLKKPVEWHNLAITPGTDAHEVRAMVANVTRRCPFGFSWTPNLAGSRPPAVTLLPGPDAVPLLLALKPLFAPLTSASVAAVMGRVFDTGLVKALGQALPRTCMHLQLREGALAVKALEQMTVSLPWLERLTLADLALAPGDVVRFVRTVKRMRQEGKAVRVEQVVVSNPERPEWCGDVAHKVVWEAAMEQVEQEGAGVVLSVEW